MGTITGNLKEPGAITVHLIAAILTGTGIIAAGEIIIKEDQALLTGIILVHKIIILLSVRKILIGTGQ